MAGGGIVKLWTNSGIQIVVLISFTFQVFLFFFARIRRKSSPVLTVLLWLVYLLADSTAIYALGHLSSTTSQSHQLVAFWAPLLLVHLGGPDSITAYTIEDSRLWHRHLLTLVVQVLGAAYVLYKYAASAGSLLLSASVLMFTIGVLKYGERTWALRCGSLGGIKSRYRHRLPAFPDFSSFMGRTLEINLQGQKDADDEELLILAHFLLEICMDSFAGSYVWIVNNPPYMHPLRGDDDMYKMIEMQLSLMYDIMYTKAWVIHTWYGYCIRVVSLVATVLTILLFSFSNKNGYSRVDVRITYFLLAGAMALDIISVLATIGSSWMCAWLCSFERIHVLVNVLKFLRRIVRAASKRRRMTSIGQYNVFHFCTRDKTELGSKVTEKIGLDKWWTNVHFVCTADISKTSLWGLLLETMPKLDPERSRGIQILERSGLGKEQAGWSHWTLNLDFGKSILLWHLATDVYLIRSKEVGRQGDLAKAVKMLSNYMMYLLVTKPDMLPGYIDETWLDSTHGSIDRMWSDHQENTTEPPPKKWWGMLKKQFHNDGPDGSRIQQIEQLASDFRSSFLSDHEGKWEYAPLTQPDHENERSSATYWDAQVHATDHAAELLHLESRIPALLEVILQVWLEMLFYAAGRCRPESHARELGRGGEFITIVWILTQHFNPDHRRLMLLDSRGVLSSKHLLGETSCH